MADEIEAVLADAPDCFQVAPAVGQPHGGLPAVGFAARLRHLPADDDVAGIIARPHAVADDFEGDGAGGDRIGNFDLGEAFRRLLLEIGVDHGPRADAPDEAHDVDAARAAASDAPSPVSSQAALASNARA